MEIIKNIYGAYPTLFECLNEDLQIYSVRYNIQETEHQDLYQWIEFRFLRKPTKKEIVTAISDYLKEEEADVMRKGFKWHSMIVCLDAENQRNYQAQYIANTTAGVPLSMTPYFFGEHSEIAYIFGSLEELKEWYTACLVYGAEIKAKYIDKRNKIDTTAYEIE